MQYVQKHFLNMNPRTKFKLGTVKDINTNICQKMLLFNSDSVFKKKI